MKQTFALLLVVLGVQLLILFRVSSDIDGMLRANLPEPRSPSGDEVAGGSAVS